MRRLLLVFTLFFVLTTPADAAWIWPVRGEVITPYRNGTDPYASGQHRGIDVAAAVGTPVVAAAGGEVRFAGTAGSSGLTVSIRTGDGYDSSYLHLASLAVRAGAHVSAGDRIGAVGTTGIRSATAPHLHFGVRDAGSRHGYHDPLAFLPPPPLMPRPTAPPAPAPAPEPADPAPDPEPIPTGAPVPRGALAPRALPTPRGAPAPDATPIPRAAPTSGLAPLPAPDHAARPFAARPFAAPGLADRTHVASGAQSSLTAPRRAADGAPARIADAESDPSAAVGGMHAEQAARSRDGVRAPHARTAAPRSATGPDIGWAIACGGLLLAAAILGLTGDNGRPTRRPKPRVAKLLRPLAGRR